jgi:hypothetical protein
MNVRSEAEILEDLERLCTTPGYIHLFAGLVVQNTFVRYADSIKGSDFDVAFNGEHLLRTELSTLLGLMVKNTIEYAHPGQDAIGQMERQTHNLLRELHHQLSAGMRPRAGEASMEAMRSIDFSSGAVLREPLFYAGESAFSYQYRDIAPLKYRADEGWLKTNLGFTMAQAANVGRAIFAIQRERVEALYNSLRAGVSEDFTFLPAFTVTFSELVAAMTEEKETIVRILEAFAVPESCRNDGFRTVSDFNIVNAQPITRRDSESFFCFQAYSFYEAVYESPYYWMIKDKVYKDIADKHRGDFPEEFSRERLERVFGKKHTFVNAHIVDQSGKDVGEVDVLVLFGNRAIVVQAKAKRLTVNARKGNDGAIRKDIEGSILSSYDQALDCGQRLLRRAERVIDRTGQEIKVPELKKVYLVCVVLEHYPALAFQAGEFLKPTVSKEIPAPLVTDVFTLDVMTEMLESPLRLLSYIDLRTGYGEKIKSGHELTILGFHLSRNLWLSKDLSVAYLDDGIANDLNAAMAVRRDNVVGERTPKGILTIMRGSAFEKVIAQLEREPRGQLVDVGLILLERSSDAAKKFSHAVEYVTARARQYGQSDVSLSDREGSGITIHSNYLPTTEGLRRLEIHAEVKKYRHKKMSWFGLGIRPDDGTVMYGINLEFEWGRDERLEEVSHQFPAERPTTFVGGRPRLDEIGRNDPCPCGSGKKYKKCHLNR